MAFNNLARQSNQDNQENIKDIEKCSWILLKSIKDNDLRPTQEYKKYWCMFYIINELNPILELFSDEQKSIQHTNSKESIGKLSLSNCLSVSIPILDSSNEKENNNEFVIILDGQLLQIYVNTKELRDEWTNCLRTKLSSLNIFSPKDNLYSKEPVSMNKNKYLKINRPLPPIPTNQDLQLNNNIRTQPTSNSSIERIRETLNRRFINNDNLNRRRINEFNNQPIATSSNDNYEHLNINNQSSINNTEQQYNTLTNFRSDLSTNNEAYLTPILSLRESQILNLNKEINNRGGVKLRLRKVDCLDSLALVDWLGHVFIAGWKQKFYPQLHNTFHLGDEIILVNSLNVSSAKQTYSLIRESDDITEFLIRRIPFGKPFLLKRDYAGQDLGIVREGNTAEILFIEPNSLAARYNITNQCVAADPLNKLRVNWYITEINFRPLNLFFKNDEIKTRLNCVGTEISLLLQPIDLVKNIRKQLKLIKNYKDYIVQ